MADDNIEQPPRGYDTADVQEQPPVKRRRRWKWKILVLLIILVPGLVFALWTWVALSYTYSSGERVGYVQKLSRKGWLCKTWEGELAISNIPGQMPEKFNFTVRDNTLASQIQRTDGQRVAVHYRQHKGIPLRCFGETEYFVDNVRVAK
ncbi:MAG: hypothetical protein ABR543_05305 [Gemmatimonadaceae bacterium]